MVQLLPIWLALLGILLGWGLLAVWLLRRAGLRGALGAFSTSWLGFAGLLGFLQLCSFVLPIARLVLVLSIAPALAGFVLQRAAVARWLATLRARERRPLVVAACASLLSSLVVAWIACNVTVTYDTGLYHLPMVNWIAEYPVVPGLANLHLRFGYNSSIHVFGAYVDAFWEGTAVHVMNSFLVAMLLAHWCTEILTARGPRARVRQVFCLLTLPFFLAELWKTDVQSLSSDVPLAVFCAVLVLELLSLDVRAGRRLLLPLAYVTSVGAVAVATKLGGGSMFAVVVVLAIFLVWRDVSWRTRAAVFALPALVVGGWMLRGVVLSGWLVFPVLGRIGLPWSVRPKIAEAHLLEIQSWARIFGKGPDEVFAHGFWGWFPTWFESFRGTRELALVIGSAILGLWRTATAPLRSAAEYAAVAACVLGLAQWFVGAPQLRYGAFLFWLLPAALLAPVLARAMRDASTRPFVIAMTLALVYWNGGFAVQGRLPPGLFDRPPDPHVAPTIRVDAGPGTTVLFPTDSDQCWNAALSCTPAPAKQTLRDPSSLGAGYLPGPPKR
jgi:hypothetical protein